MLNENAKLWVAALRSGKHKQGKSRLRTTGDEFCCLGVGCEVALKNGVSLKVTKDEYEFAYDEYTGTLPPKVVRWLGLASDNGQLKEHSLIWENDVKAKSFSEIADLIESEPEGLFA